MKMRLHLTSNKLRSLPYVTRHSQSRPGLDTSNTRIIFVKPA